MAHPSEQRRRDWRESFDHARTEISAGRDGPYDINCVFCRRIYGFVWQEPDGDRPGCWTRFARQDRPEPETPVVEEWPDHVAFRPLNPVTPLHTLIVPRFHVPNHTYGLALAETMMRAAELARSYEYAGYDTNLICSSGPAASQTVNHLHVHLVERTHGDGIRLPWTHPDERKKAATDA